MIEKNFGQFIFFQIRIPQRNALVKCTLYTLAARLAEWMLNVEVFVEEFIYLFIITFTKFTLTHPLDAESTGKKAFFFFCFFEKSIKSQN